LTSCYIRVVLHVADVTFDKFFSWSLCFGAVFVSFSFTFGLSDNNKRGDRCSVSNQKIARGVPECELYQAALARVSNVRIDESFPACPRTCTCTTIWKKISHRDRSCCLHLKRIMIGADRCSAPHWTKHVTCTLSSAHWKCPLKYVEFAAHYSHVTLKGANEKITAHPKSVKFDFDA